MPATGVDALEAPQPGTVDTEPVTVDLEPVTVDLEPV